ALGFNALSPQDRVKAWKSDLKFAVEKMDYKIVHIVLMGAEELSLTIDPQDPVILADVIEGYRMAGVGSVPADMLDPLVKQLSSFCNTPAILHGHPLDKLARYAKLCENFDLIDRVKNRIDTEEINADLMVAAHTLLRNDELPQFIDKIKQKQNRN